MKLKSFLWALLYLITLCSTVILLIILGVPGVIFNEFSWPLLLIAFLWLIFSFIFHIFIHESGHLVFGIISGYKLIMFQVLGITWKKSTNKKILTNVKFNTLGQCLMEPPRIKNGTFPFRRYLLGGITLNLLFVLITLIIIETAGTSIFLNIFLILGVFFILSNLIPFTFNDGMLLLNGLKGKHQRIELYIQMYVNCEMVKGSSYKKMSKKVFRLSDNSDIFNYYYNLELNNYDRANELIIKLLSQYKDQFFGIDEELEKEHLFIMSVNGDKNRAIEMYSKISNRKGFKLKSLSDNRILAYYHTFINQDPVISKKFILKAREALGDTDYNNSQSQLEEQLINRLPFY